MQKKTLFLVLIFMIITFAVVSTTDTSASTKKTQGLYTTLEYTDEFFPEYEEFTVSFFITKTDALELTRNQSLYLTGYRVVLNTTLLAYIDHSGDYYSYTPILEKKELSYDAGDYELSANDFNVNHKLTIQIFAVVIDDEGNEELIADDYLTVEIMFLREANTSEIIQILLVTVIPIGIFSLVFFIKKRINNSTFENVTYVTMIRYYLRRFFLREHKEQETTRTISVSHLSTEELAETQTQLQQKKTLEKLAMTFIFVDAPLLIGFIVCVLLHVERSLLYIGILIITTIIALEIISWLSLRLRFLLQQPKKEKPVIVDLEQPKTDESKQSKKESNKEKAKQ